MNYKRIITILIFAIVPLWLFAQPCTQKIFFWSPQTTNAAATIWIMDTTGANRKALFNDAYYRRTLTVSADGTKLAYTKRKNPNSGTGGDSLWICTSDINGQNEVHHYLLPTYANTEIRDLDFNSNHTKILFNTFEGVNRDGDIYVLNLANAAVTQLTFNTDTCKGEPQYSPDDSRITYCQNGTPWYAYPFPGRKMNSNGTNFSPFNPAGYGNYHQFNYSPNGQKYVFTYFASLNTPYKLYTVDTNGSNLLYLNYQTFSQMQPVFNPDGTKIGIVDNNTMKLLNSANGAVLQTIMPGANTGFNNINWVTVCCSVPPPVLAASPTSAALCIGQNKVLNVTGAEIYSWSPATGLSSTTTGTVTATPSATTAYTVIGSNLFGCHDTETINITVNPVPNVNSGGNKTICAGSPAQLQATGAASYTWSPSAGLSCSNCSNPSANPSTTTLYTVTGTDGNGCANTSPATVTVNPIPLVSVAPANSTICSGKNVALTASGSAANYTWSPATGLSATTGSTVTATPAATTNYTVTATDNNNCTNTAVASVTVIPTPAAPVVTPAIQYCQDVPAATLTAPGSNLQWYATPVGGIGSVVAPTPNTTLAGTYTYYVSQTVNGCESSRSLITVTVHPLPNVSVTPPTPVLCQGETAALAATGASSYSWSPGTGLSNTNTANVNATPAATTIYTVTGSDANGCNKAITVTITVNAVPPPPAVSSPVVYCRNDVAAQLSATGQNLSWYIAATGGSPLTLTPTPFTSNPGTTTYYVSQTGNGCESSRSAIEVLVNKLPEVDVLPVIATICNGNSIIIQASGTGVFSWSPVTALEVLSPTTVKVSPATTTQYIVRCTDTNNCSDTAHALIKVNPVQAIMLNERICLGGTFVFLGDTLSKAGEYKKTFKTYLGCDSVVTLSLQLDTPAHAKFDMQPDACLNAPVRITPYDNPSQATYTWGFYDAAILSGSGIEPYNVSWADTGLKQVTLVTKLPACEPYTFTGNIHIHHPYIRILPFNMQAICYGDTIAMAVKKDVGLTYQWLPAEKFITNNQPEVLAVAGNAMYKIAVQDSWNCTAADSVMLHTAPCCTLAIPNAFTPNNDGRNDVFRLITDGHHQLEKFIVTNRFGTILFETNNQYAGWDGTFNGVPQELGTYYYFVRYKCNGIAPTEKKGDVILIR